MLCFLFMLFSCISCIHESAPIQAAKLFTPTFDKRMVRRMALLIRAGTNFMSNSCHGQSVNQSITLIKNELRTEDVIHDQFKIIYYTVFIYCGYVYH